MNKSEIQDRFYLFLDNIEEEILRFTADTGLAVEDIGITVYRDMEDEVTGYFLYSSLEDEINELEE